VRRLGVAVLLVAIAGCTDEPAQVVRKTIGPEGGQVSSHDGVLSLLFHPGALPRATEIEVFPSDRPPPAFGPAYRVKPDLDLEVAMDVTYHGALPDDPARSAIAAIRRQHFEDGVGSWVGLPVTEVDPDKQLIAGLDAELSLYYGLLEDAMDPPSPSTTDPSTTTDDPTGGSDTGDPPTDTGAVPLSYAFDVEPIIAENCTDATCHADGVTHPNRGTNGYDNLVDRPSLVAAADLVVPGDSTRSYLMHKLDNTHTLDPALGGCGCNGAGMSMPQSRDLLPEETRDVIREWIDGGAAP
jgi:hypothetical protein